MSFFCAIFWICSFIVKYKENAEYTEQFIKQLKELLAMSLKVEEGQKIEYVLNTEEVSILTEMALIY